MSTATRKARKRAAVPFSRVPKVGTPVDERAENQPRDLNGTAWLKQPRFGITSHVAARLGARSAGDEVSA